MILKKLHHVYDGAFLIYGPSNSATIKHLLRRTLQRSEDNWKEKQVTLALRTAIFIGRTGKPNKISTQ